MDLSEFSDAFFEEADELLVEIETHLLDIDLDDPDPEQLNAVFRAAHSIKGGAGTFGFTVLQETTHLLENLLDDARKGKLVLTRKLVDTFLETRDMLKEQLEAYQNGDAPDQAQFEQLCDVLQQIAEDNRNGGSADAKAAPAAAKAGTATPAKDPATEATDAVASTAPPDHDQPEEQNMAPAEPSEGPTSAEFELFDSEPMESQRYQVSLFNVSDDDRKLLIEELGNLGHVVSHSGDEARTNVVFVSEENVETIEAVLCFVIDTDQLEISLLDDTEQEPSDPTTEGVAEAGSAVDESAADDPAASAESPPPMPAPDQMPKESVVAASPPASSATGKPTEDKPPVKAKAKPAAGESSTIRVAVDKVDQVINLVGELIITQSMLNATAHSMDGLNHNELLNGINLLQRNARDLQDAVMSIRMLPMDYVFSRFPRLVRDLAGKLEKEIDLVTIGESTELDKGLTERIIDPLTHLVRNSLDHGIETPDVREAAGKSRNGTLTLSAQHEGGNILIEVRDDGAGLNRERILAKARSNGMQIADNISDEEVWQLIFAPGFSTAEQVSDLSGRGVGMDVVKRNIQGMGGYVEIMSKQGEGTTTRIVLPLTLAILDGMLIKVRGEIYILPVSSIIESLQLVDHNLSALPGDIPMLKVRQEYYPVISIADAMGIDSYNPNIEVAERRTAVMVQAGNLKYVMLVDELLGQQQVVVKNIESNYRKIEGVSAATILGDGSVALILDIGDLYRLGQAALRAKNKKRREATKKVNEKPLAADRAITAQGDGSGPAAPASE